MYVCLMFMYAHPCDQRTIGHCSSVAIHRFLRVSSSQGLTIWLILPSAGVASPYPHTQLSCMESESNYSPHACMSSTWKSLPQPTSLEWKTRLCLLIPHYHPPPKHSAAPNRSLAFPQPCVTCHPQAIEKPPSQAGRTYLQRVKRTVSSLWEATITSALGLCFSFSRT